MILIAKYEGKIWAGVYMLRAETIRLISVGRALERETDLCEKENTFL
jgi:uncharacterized DUF497 family protein